MIERTLKTTQGRLKLSIPTQLNEVSLGQMIDLQEAKDMTDLDAISILSGVSVADLQNVADANDFTQFADGVLTLSNEIKNLYNSEKVPTSVTVTIDGKPVKVSVINNLSVEPAGAFMAARDIIADEIAAHIKQNGEDNWQETFKPSLLACAKLLAQYFFTRVTGLPYDEYAAAEFLNVVKKLWVTEALPIAKHFFTSYPDLSKPKTDFWPRLLQLLKNVLVSGLSNVLSTSIR
ncbi:hypothetical protein DYU05_08875 [Mucilaginibacter terrenus]|uniref:Uncharacterized protein n=1 Tax=Mucilaginibacter terrenus TaxID=2482727 RepID=A0A3E2NXH8_9SPHI|nr:hypothetical protein [Mucilaginibacter terrenus]RFZ85692.1 hypothetical protein DYU05_08875 [Mucilaginibacter terrenus]